MDKKKVVFIAIFIFGLALFLLAGNVFSDDVAVIPSEVTSGPGAWYDEAWWATKFYRLEQVTPIPTDSSTYIYEETITPTTNATTTFVQSGDGTGASIPQDMVVTEWQVTGHAHFPSGLE